MLLVYAFIYYSNIHTYMHDFSGKLIDQHIMTMSIANT